MEFGRTCSSCKLRSPNEPSNRCPPSTFSFLLGRSAFPPEKPAVGYASYINPSEDCPLRGETSDEDGFEVGDDRGSVLAYVSKAVMTVGSCAAKWRRGGSDFSLV